MDSIILSALKLTIIFFQLFNCRGLSWTEWENDALTNTSCTGGYAYISWATPDAITLNDVYSVEWTKDGTRIAVLNTTKQFLDYYDGRLQQIGIFGLQINSVDSNTKGEYQCEVIDASITTHSARATLLVYDPPTNCKPSVQKNGQTADCTLPADIVCHGFNCSTQWMFTNLTEEENLVLDEEDIYTDHVCCLSGDVVHKCFPDNYIIQYCTSPKGEDGSVSTFHCEWQCIVAYILISIDIFVLLGVTIRLMAWYLELGKITEPVKLSLRHCFCRYRDVYPADSSESGGNHKGEDVFDKKPLPPIPFAKNELTVKDETDIKQSSRDSKKQSKRDDLKIEVTYTTTESTDRRRGRKSGQKEGKTDKRNNTKPGRTDPESLEEHIVNQGTPATEQESVPCDTSNLHKEKNEL